MKKTKKYSKKLIEIQKEHYESKEFESFDEIVNNFLSTIQVKIKLSCFEVPGTVVNGKVKLTNLP